MEMEIPKRKPDIKRLPERLPQGRNSNASETFRDLWPSGYSFGLMLGTSFIVASLLLTSELKRKKLDPELGSTITLIALFGGVAGSKILYLIENGLSLLPTRSA